MKILERQLDNTQTQKNYSRVAWFYNLWSQLTESRTAEKVIELADIEDGQKVIEIACGTGLVFKKVVAKNQSGQNIGIDLSIDMLSKAKKAMKNQASDNYELLQGDALNLKIGDDTYDILINNFMLDLMPEDKFDDILATFYRILKPNGIAVISIFTEGKKGVNNYWVLVAKHFPILLTDCRPIEIKENIKKVGFKIEHEIEISQNTFPSKVYKLRK